MSTEPNGKTQPAVEIERLRSRLVNSGVQVQEIDLGASSEFTLLLFGSKVPPIPFGDREYVWYPLLFPRNHTTIERAEADALLRHCWHSVIPFFEEELEQELAPANEREQELFDKVGTKAQNVRNGKEKWDDAMTSSIRGQVSFQLTDAECDYLDALIQWKQLPSQPE